MKLNIEKSVCVITPTIGSEKLQRCVESVAAQNYRNLTHLLVYDGKGKESFKSYDHVHTCMLPWNVGTCLSLGGPFYGHRVYAAFAHIVNHDYVFFLDEDNWYEPGHLKSAVQVFDQNPHVNIVYSLRKIFDKDGEYLCDDNCESLGTHLAYTGRNLADTSSLSFRRSFLVQTSSLWHSGWGGDARYLNAVTNNWKNTSHIRGTGFHTLCYRLDGNPNSVTKEFFDRGNAKMLEQFGSVINFPWLNLSS